MSIQLPLSIELAEEKKLDDFYWGDSVLSQAIEQFLNGSNESFFYLWGAVGSGKSHILQAICQQANTLAPSIYIPCEQLKSLDTALLDDLESTQFIIAIDDIELISQQPKWEEAIFHLYNRIRNHPHARLIVASKYAPTKIPIDLPDLKSRLQFGYIFETPVLSDQVKVDVIMSIARKKGFSLSSQSAQFLINHYDRNMQQLSDALVQLDRASLREKRKITIPFIKTVLD